MLLLRPLPLLLLHQSLLSLLLRGYAFFSRFSLFLLCLVSLNRGLQRLTLSHGINIQVYGGLKDQDRIFTNIYGEQVGFASIFWFGGNP